MDHSRTCSAPAWKLAAAPLHWRQGLYGQGWSEADRAERARRALLWGRAVGLREARVAGLATGKRARADGDSLIERALRQQGHWL